MTIGIRFFIDQLAGQNHVIAVELPGVGASRGQVPLTIEEMASQVIEFVQLLGFSKINLLGLSMGGMIAQAVAEKKARIDQPPSFSWYWSTWRSRNRTGFNNHFYYND